MVWYKKPHMELANLKQSTSVRVFSSFEEAEAADIAYWRSLTPEQRLDAVGECVRHYLALRNEPEQGFCRVYRVLDQKKG
jgi:hypothetical protein